MIVSGEIVRVGSGVFVTVGVKVAVDVGRLETNRGVGVDTFSLVNSREMSAPASRIIAIANTIAS